MEQIQTIDDSPVNFASCFKMALFSHPHKRAIIYPVNRDKNERIAYTHMTFLELDRESDCIAHGLEKAGICKGTKTLIMVKPGFEYFILVLSLLKAGAVPVLIDMSMDKTRILTAIKRAEPEAMIATSSFHMMRIRTRKNLRFFKSIKTLVTIGTRFMWGGFRINDIIKSPWRPYGVAEVEPEDAAIIHFGLDGISAGKGKIYSHKFLINLINKLQAIFKIDEDEIDFPTLPILDLISLSLGMTIVITNSDFKPQNSFSDIIENIKYHGVTNLFASPNLLNKISSFITEREGGVSSLKRVVAVGPVTYPSILSPFDKILSEQTEFYSCYGGADDYISLISVIESSEIFTEAKPLTDQGFGICIGRPFGDINLKIIKISDEPIYEWSDDLLVTDGDIGEIIVSDNLLSKSCFGNCRNEISAKIQDKDKFFRRLGDLGWKDKKGRIWFCGRKNHRIITNNGTLFTIPCESIFNNHSKVLKSALVALDAKPEQTPVMCIEVNPDDIDFDKEALKEQLLDLAKQNVQTEYIQIILFHKSFPVDFLHNINILRKSLTKWAKRIYETT
ncbi:MAG: AMP-binding protein [Desulfobacterales bacterium]|nr:AMP-binding protein [Desulfobacterales bacterium]